MFWVNRNALWHCWSGRWEDSASPWVTVFFRAMTFAREYHVSQGTAHKAMAELVRRGYLESSHRSGYFVRQLAAGLSGRDESQDRVGRATTTTLLMIVGDVGQWGDQLLEQYSQAVEKACRRVGWRLLRIKNDAREIEKVQEDVKVAGCLTYGLREARRRASIRLQLLAGVDDGATRRHHD